MTSWQFSFRIAVLCTLLGATAAHGQVRRVFLAPDGQQEQAPTTGPVKIEAEAGQTIPLTAWFQDSIGPEGAGLLNSYQLIVFWSATPLEGQAGDGTSITYVNNPPTGGAGDTVALDTADADWIFALQPVFLNPVFNETPETIFGVIYSTIQGFGVDATDGDTPLQNVPNPGGIHYLADFEVQVGPNASGQYELAFNTPGGSPPFSALFDPNGGPYAGGFVEFQPLLINLPSGCDGCEIGGTCYADGTLNPDNDCEACDADNSTTDWTPLAKGTSCADDGDICTTNLCDGAGVCAALPNDGPCDDRNACTTEDACFEGVCLGGPPPDCDDFNDCTDDDCDRVLGCVHEDNMDPCDDGDICTMEDACFEGACVGGPPLDCDDLNDCTDDSCDMVLGCVHEDNMGPCDDGDACTVGDSCDSGECLPGNDVDCTVKDDECSLASCDPDGAEGNCDILEPINEGQPCNDGAGTCMKGICKLPVGEGVRVFMARDGEQNDAPTSGPTTIVVLPGETATVHVWVEDTVGADVLNGYLLLLPARLGSSVTPQNHGSISYVDNPPFHSREGDSALIDNSDPAWPFPENSEGARVYREPMRRARDADIGLFFRQPRASFGVDLSELGIIHYLGEFDVEASPDADGTFQMEFLFPETYVSTRLMAPFGGPFDVGEFQPLIIEVLKP